MKQLIFGCVSLMAVALFAFVLVTIHGETLRQAEMTQSLGEAMQSVMEGLKAENKYSFDNKDEFVTAFLELLVMQIGSDSDITVHILKADEKKGLLSVEVTASYEHINGRKGQVSAIRTILLDQDVSDNKDG